MKKVIVASIAQISILLLLASCHRSQQLVVDEALLTRYHQLGHDAVAVATPSSDEIDCYLDYSAGMGEGMRASAEINGKLKDFLGGRSVTYYRVGASHDPPSIDINSSAANWIDLNNYRERGSKLKVALDRMTATKNKVSLFITDFERVEDVALRQELAGAPGPHPIDASAWGQTDFKEWLLAGGQIDVFATQYTKPDYWFDQKHATAYPNWIYTIVFTPGSIVENDGAFSSSVVPFLLEAYRGESTRHFAYNATAFAIEQANAPAIGNANENIVVQDQFTTSSGKGFEFYEFTSKDLMAFNTDATQKDKRIINHVRITSHVPFLSDVEFGIKAYDVTEPLSSLFKQVNEPAAVTSTDVETGETVVEEVKPAEPTIAPAQPVDDIFDFVYNAASHEAGVKLKSDFAGVPATSVYRVDVYLASADIKDTTGADETMALNYGGGYTIHPLSESIKLAVRDVTNSMIGKVLYTFYVQIDK